MLRNHRRVWWRRRRLWLGIWGGLVVIALTVALVRSNDSNIVIYNDTGFALPACGQDFTLAGIAAETSIRIRLLDEGAASDIQMKIMSVEPIVWEGGYIEPSGGYRIEVRVSSDMSIRFGSQISFWQWWRGF
jgi:hypothetical protein